MTVRQFHWDPIDDCVLSETDGSGNTLVTYTREPGAFGPLLSEDRAGDVRHHHYDALGSTTLLTDDTGAVTDTFQYDAWGNELDHAGTTDTPYRWIGRFGYQHDTVVGSYHVRFRDYQPTIARWNSKDPVRSDLNRYRYVNNAAVANSDPSGLLPTLPSGCEQYFSDFLRALAEGQMKSGLAFALCPPTFPFGGLIAPRATLGDCSEYGWKTLDVHFYIFPGIATPTRNICLAKYILEQCCININDVQYTFYFDAASALSVLDPGPIRYIAPHNRYTFFFNREPRMRGPDGNLAGALFNFDFWDNLQSKRPRWAKGQGVDVWWVTRLKQYNGTETQPGLTLPAYGPTPRKYLTIINNELANSFTLAHELIHATGGYPDHNPVPGTLMFKLQELVGSTLTADDCRLARSGSNLY